MLSDYLKEMSSAAIGSAFSEAGVIVILIGVILFLLPGRLSAYLKPIEGREYSIRRRLLVKFCSNDTWTMSLTVICLLIIHLGFVTPYQLYSKNRKLIKELSEQTNILGCELSLYKFQIKSSSEDKEENWVILGYDCFGKGDYVLACGFFGKAFEHSASSDPNLLKYEPEYICSVLLSNTPNAKIKSEFPSIASERFRQSFEVMTNRIAAAVNGHYYQDGNDSKTNLFQAEYNIKRVQERVGESNSNFLNHIIITIESLRSNASNIP